MFYLLRGIGDRDAGGGGATVALAASPLRYPQPFLTPKPLDLLVIDHPTLGTNVVISRPKSASWMGAGILAQQRPQTRIRIGHGGGRRLASLGCSVLPGHPAGEPLTDLHRGDELINGRPPAIRAQKFPFAISLSAAFSSSASTSCRLSEAFSRSSSLSRLASSAFRPPNWLRHRK